MTDKDRLAEIESDHREFTDKHGITCDDGCDDCYLITELKAARAEIERLRLLAPKEHDYEAKPNSRYCKHCDCYHGYHL